MKKFIIYAFGLGLFGAMLCAASIPTKEKEMLNKILVEVENLSKQPPNVSVPVNHRINGCGRDFFCFAEKSLNTINNNNNTHLKKLCHQIHEYNKLTNHTTCADFNDKNPSCLVPELLTCIEKCVRQKLNSLFS